jgi:hypothetical protein
MSIGKQRLSVGYAEPAERQTAYCATKHRELWRGLAAGQYQAALVRGFSDSLQ